MIFMFERSSACHQLVEQDSCCPDIHWLSVASSKHLRGPVIESPSDGPHLYESTSPSESFGNPKINQFYSLSLRVIKDVFRFDISVHDVPFMEIAESIHELKHQLLDVFLTLYECLFKRRRVDQLHHQPSHTLSGVNIEGLIFDNVGKM